jgi:WD40 repeat protein
MIFNSIKHIFLLSESINCLVTIDNWLIATADDNGCVKIWDYRKKNAVMESKSDCNDYISDLAVSRDKKFLLATCGEGTLSAFHTRKKKMIMQSELMDSEMLCVGFMKVRS